MKLLEMLISATVVTGAAATFVSAVPDVVREAERNVGAYTHQATFTAHVASELGSYPDDPALWGPNYVPADVAPQTGETSVLNERGLLVTATRTTEGVCEVVTTRDATERSQRTVTPPCAAVSYGQ